MKTKTARSYNSQTGLKLSRAAIRKINAVEGIDLDGRIEKQLEEYDRRGLTPDERRKAVREKFAKSAS
ncbi:MAG: hypothetical protein K0U74_03155 [Alphaproteobacteria bacterium]|nr:hypothetical protein [Alphaproteobacteria bacterium]